MLVFEPISQWIWLILNLGDHYLVPLKGVDSARGWLSHGPHLNSQIPRIEKMKINASISHLHVWNDILGKGGSRYA